MIHDGTDSRLSMSMQEQEYRANQERFRADLDYDRTPLDLSPLHEETPGMADGIPPKILEGLRLYARHHKPVGGFLAAVLKNDLNGAVCRADVDSLAAILKIVKFVYNALPSPSWGNAEIVEQWLKDGEK